MVTSDVNCMRLDVMTCTHHYRNTIVDTWSAVGITRVGFLYVKDLCPKWANVEFNFTLLPNSIKTTPVRVLRFISGELMLFQCGNHVKHVAPLVAIAVLSFWKKMHSSGRKFFPCTISLFAAHKKRKVS